MSKAKQMPNGKWRLRSFVGRDSNGKQIFESFTCDTEAACYRAEKAWLKAGGKKIVEEDQSGPTIGEAVEAYITKCEQSKTKAYSPATIRGYRNVQKALASIENTKVADITIDDIQDYVDFRADSVVKKTIINELYLLKPSLKLAKRKDLDFDELELPEQEQEDYVIPTDEEVQALLNFFKDNDNMYLAITLGAFCGMRRSEIAALEWQDVYDNKIHVQHAVVMNQFHAYVQKNTKSRAGKREISISNEVMNVIKHKAIKEKRTYRADERLCSLQPDSITREFIRARDALGYSFTFHGLRHYHASTMLALNIPKFYIVKDMGHADFKMVEKVYGQIVQEKRDAIASVVGNHSDTILKGEHYEWRKIQNS